MIKRIIVAALLTQTASSSYVTRLLNVTTCKNPVPPYAATRILQDYVGVTYKDNNTLISGNVTYFKSVYNVKWTFKVEKKYKGSRRLVLRFKDLSCKHVLIRVMSTVFAMDMDFKTCTINPTTYVFKDVDIDLVEQKIRLPFRSDGIFYYTMVMFMTEGAQLCYEVTVSVALTKNLRKTDTLVPR